MTDSIPTVKEELERKLVDGLVTLANDIEIGKKTKFEAREIANALWACTAGLVDTEISNLCSDMANDSAAQRPTKSIRLLGKGRLLQILWKTERPGFTLVASDATTGVMSVLKKSSIAADVRGDAINALIDLLLRTGHVKIN
jgi:hypothetical protein